MAKILCAISGIEFTCEHVPMVLHSRECVHPIFYLPQKKLLGLYGKWVQQELTEIDSYLLFLAFLNSTELLVWNVPAQRIPETKSIIANNISKLVSIITKIDAIKHPSFSLAKISINTGTKTLSNVDQWIHNWTESYTDFMDGYKKAKISEDLARKLMHREATLERLIKDPQKELGTYARILALWAADAGNFPTYLVSNPITGIKTPMAECTKEDKIFLIPKIDLQDLIEHCEENIMHGSIYAHSLMGLLKAGLNRQSNFLGLGDINLTTTTFQILDAETSVEDANKLLMIQNTPTELPRPEQYPTKLAYLRAKARYDLASSYNAGLRESETAKEMDI